MIFEFPDLPHASPSWALGLRPIPPSGSAFEFALWDFKGKVFRSWNYDTPLAGPAFPSLAMESGFIQLHKVLSICDFAHFQGYLDPTDGCTIASSSRSGFVMWRAFLLWITAPFRTGWLFAWTLDDRQHEVIERLRSVDFDLVRFDYYFGEHQRHWGWHVKRDVALAFQ